MSWPIMWAGGSRRWGAPGGCYGLNCVPQIPSLTPSTSEYDLFGDRVFKEVSNIKWGHWVVLIQCDWCLYKKRKLGHRHTEGWPREDTGRRRLSASQGERPQEKPTLLTPWSQTSSLQDCEGIKLFTKPPSLSNTIRSPMALSRTLDQTSVLHPNELTDAHWGAPQGSELGPFPVCIPWPRTSWP